jgi:hypothetical protein
VRPPAACAGPHKKCYVTHFEKEFYKKTNFTLRVFNISCKFQYLSMQIRQLYSSPDIFGVIKSRIMRREACGTYGGEVGTGFWWENLRGRDYLEDLGADGMIILKWILRKSVRSCGLD